MPMDRGLRNARELRELSNRREWLFVKGIKNWVVDNGDRWFVRGFGRYRGKVMLPSISGNCRVGARLPTEYGNRFIMDDESREFLLGEEQAD
jgi:hypothetical protein